MVIRFKAYNRHSRGLAALASALIERGHQVYRYDRDSNVTVARNIANDVIINWGASQEFPLVRRGLAAPLPHAPVLNAHSAVVIATNKLSAFNVLRNAGVIAPVHTVHMDVARAWQATGNDVVERHVLNGHSGNGIRIVTPQEQLQQAPLYTRYVKKAEEYRVHVFNGQVIDIQQKRSKRQALQAIPDFKVRNLAGGWVYCRENLDITGGRDTLENLAIAALAALGLDFGAVDIIYNRRNNQFYVLEVNTAVGLEGTTAQLYAAAIHEYVENLNNGVDVRAPRW